MNRACASGSGAAASRSDRARLTLSLLKLRNGSDPRFADHSLLNAVAPAALLQALRCSTPMFTLDQVVPWGRCVR